jgi:hypothetical protein
LLSVAFFQSSPLLLLPLPLLCKPHRLLSTCLFLCLLLVSAHACPYHDNYLLLLLLLPLLPIVMVEQLPYIAASANQPVDYHSIDPYNLSLLSVSSATAPIVAATSTTAMPMATLTTPVVPIHRSGISSTSRNGGSNQILGPFFCRWEGCPMTGCQFPTGDAIWRHLETTHFNARSRRDDGLMCRWSGCDEVRPSLFRLKSHMRKHLDWRPFGCQLCDERFKHRGDQKKHLARKHANATSTTRASPPAEQEHQTSPQSQYTYAPVTFASTHPSDAENPTLQTNYYVSNSTSPSPDATVTYPVFASVPPMPLAAYTAVSKAPSSQLATQTIAPGQQLMVDGTLDENVGLSSLMNPQCGEPTVTPYAPTDCTQDVTCFLKNAPTLENVCGWLQDAAYAQPISQATDDDEEDRHSWSSFGPEKTPESTLLSDMTHLSPLLLAGGSSTLTTAATTTAIAATQYTPPSMVAVEDGHDMLPTSLPPPAIFEGLDSYVGGDDHGYSLSTTTYEQLGLTGLTV